MSSGVNILTKNAPQFRQALLGWFAQHRRSMPWRDQPSAYRTVVSELMCQQTQIATVIPYFNKWVKKWPDFKNLARAKESEILAHWAGLGYYSRARHLRNCAIEVSRLKILPTRSVDWQKFKGIGPYTAAAISSIAFNEAVAVVDGNVVRVLARLTNTQTVFDDRTSAAKYFTPLADQLVDSRRPGDFNQAMMELGALVCRKALPLCESCPVATWCLARKNKSIEAVPKFKQIKRQSATTQRALIFHGGKFLLKRNLAEVKRLAGMAEIPELSFLDGHYPVRESWTRRRTIGRVTYDEKINLIRVNGSLLKKIRREPSLEWVARKNLKSAALTGPHLRWIEEWLNQAGRIKLGKSS